MTGESRLARAASPITRRRISLESIPGLPEAQPGDDPAALIAEAVAALAEPLAADDVLVVAHKFISKCEGRLVRLADVTPGARAIELAESSGRDPRLVQVVLDESVEVVRASPRVLITESRQGFVCANAGVDRSNVPEGMVALLPVDSDASARRLRDGLELRLGVAPAVVISDTFGRPWRTGLVNVALGCAGLSPLHDLRGAADAQGRELSVTVIAEADELAAAAELLMGKDWNIPAVLVRGFHPTGEGPGTDLIRRRDQDLFRE